MWWLFGLKKRLDEDKRRIDELEEKVRLLEMEMDEMIGGGIDRGFLKGEFENIVDHLYMVNGRCRKE